MTGRSGARRTGRWPAAGRAETVCAFSRKNGRFSGKNSGNRVRLICCSSASTCAKSVLTVTSSVRSARTPHLKSSPTSPRRVDGIGAERLVVVDRAGNIGNELQVAARRQAEPLELAGHRHAMQVVAARHRREEDLLVLAPDVAHDVDAPRAVLAGVVAERLERDRELGFPAALGRAARGPSSRRPSSR